MKTKEIVFSLPRAIKMVLYLATKIIRESQDNKVSIIAVTAAGVRDNPITITDTGFDGLVLKPYKEMDIYGAIEKTGVEYIFSEEVPAAQDISETAKPDILADQFLGNVPSELVEKLRCAAMKARPDMVMETLGQLEALDPNAFRTIKQFLNVFNYGAILKFLSEYQEQQHIQN